MLMPAERITAPGSITRDLGESWCVRTRFAPRHQYRGHIQTRRPYDRRTTPLPATAFMTAGGDLQRKELKAGE